MATVQEKIASLEEEIAGYRVDLRNAITPEEISEIRGLIKSSRDTLNRLLDELASLRSSTFGKSFGISPDELFYSHHIFNS
jgi:hypothetical protein